MSYSIIQEPQFINAGQSPIIFSVSSSQYVGANNFQYIAELSIWTGSTSNSASAEVWTLAKYPSSQGFTGIFDVSRILNSTQTQLAINIPSDSALKNFRIESYYRYQSGSSYVTGSHITSSVYQALDGYKLFPQPIDAVLYEDTCGTWPLMYDGPLTQSVLAENKGNGYVYMLNVELSGSSPSKIKYTSDAGTAYFNLDTSSLNTTANLIQEFPLYPSSTSFPLTGSYNWYTIQPVDSSNNPVTNYNPIKYELVCNQKYPNVRIAFKNRFGVLQFINMNMVNRKGFQTTKRTYQPQLGSWQGQTLSYDSYDSQTLNYIADSKQTISCNTNWLDESWNQIIKQLLMSDEIYMVKELDVTCDDPTYDNLPYLWEYRPLTITTQNLVFKTGVNDHLIQYQFDFEYGQGYKLII